MRTWMSTTMENFESVTINEAMRVMSDEDLTFIATYYPMMLQGMCLMATLENQLEIEGKASNPPVILKTRESENWFVYLRRRFKEWLFSRLLRMVSKR